ncbi:TolC family protein [Acinetobacter modestus]|uniref:TolC family protein n=1 Tax=Acinetobacter modestus TaxID=1776740 RepID=UPI00202DD6CD|nr:TolC family protein [Acinetobacter modestus]MCM1958045.1 TolC family protein [Acinetobacter modestus]
MMYPTLDVVDKAVEQVHEKMNLFESRISSYTSQLTTALNTMSNIVVGGDLPEAPLLEYNNNLPPNYQLITPPNFILPSIVPPVLDFGEMQAIAAPQPINIPEITFSVDLPVLPTLLEPPAIEELDLEDPEFDIATLAVPEIPSQIFEMGDMPVPVDLSKILSDLNLSDLELPESPIVTIPNEINVPVLAQLEKPEKPVFEDIEFPAFPEIAKFPDFPEFEEKLDLPPKLDFEKINAEFEELIANVDEVNTSIKDETTEFINGYFSSSESIFSSLDEARTEAMEIAKKDYEGNAASNWLFSMLEEWRNGKATPWSGVQQQIEQQSIDAVFDRENRVTQSEVKAVYQDWAARGFSMPQGAMAKRVDYVRTQGNLRASEASRALAVEAFKEKIQEVRLIFDRCLDVEQRLYDRFMQKKKHELDVVQLKFDFAKMRLNELKEVFQIRMDATKYFMETYKYYIEMTMKKMETIRFQLEYLDYEMKIRKFAIDLYKQKVEAIMVNVEVYKTMMDTVKLRIDTIKTQFDLYKTELDGFATESNFEKIKADLYGTQIQAEGQRLGLFETMAKNYIANIQGLSARADVLNKQQGLKLEAAKVDLQRYQSDLDYRRTILQEQSKANQDLTSNYVRQIEAFKTAVGMQLGVVDAKGKYAQVRANLKIANADMRSKYADMNARISISNVDLQTKFLDMQSRSQLANLDAQVKHADMQTRVGISNAEIQARVSESNARMYTAKADVQTKYADMQTRTNLAVADMQSKNADIQARVGIANAEIQTRFAELNSKIGISNNEMRLKQYDSQISKIFQKTQLALDAEKAIAQYSAQLAAGALSAMHVSASISGSGSSSMSYGASESESTSHNYSY